ncbi:MAG: hypothetical protein PHP39_07470 [Oscillospiraceae bacterium]|nr:hypothetical protein [Oscillospiraceae bacterium]
MRRSQNPARPTPAELAGQIQTAFVSSGCRHLLITGLPGRGKSTVLQALLPWYLPRLAGGLLSALQTPAADPAGLTAAGSAAAPPYRRVVLWPWQPASNGARDDAVAVWPPERVQKIWQAPPEAWLAGESLGKGQPLTVKPVAFREAAGYLRALGGQPGDFVLLDELGWLENSQPAYLEQVQTLAGQKRLLAVIRKQGSAAGDRLRARQDSFTADLDCGPA